MRLANKSQIPNPKLQIPNVLKIGIWVLGLGFWIAAAQQAPHAQSQALLIRNVTVIDGMGAPARRGMDVAIAGNRISGVGSNLRVPPHAHIVDGTGKFLIPGLWDMHIHIHRWDELTLLVANGITGVRLMAELPEYYKMRAAVDAGTVPGPRMSISSRIFDGLIPSQILAPPPGDAASEAEEWRSVERGEGRPRALLVTNAAAAVSDFSRAPIRSARGESRASASTTRSSR